MFELITIVFWFYTKRKEQKDSSEKKCTASKTEQNGSNKQVNPSNTTIM